MPLSLSLSVTLVRILLKFRPGGFSRPDANAVNAAAAALRASNQPPSPSMVFPCHIFGAPETYYVYDPIVRLGNWKMFSIKLCHGVYFPCVLIHIYIFTCIFQTVYISCIQLHVVDSLSSSVNWHIYSISGIHIITLATLITRRHGQYNQRL